MKNWTAKLLPVPWVVMSLVTTLAIAMTLATGGHVEVRVWLYQVFDIVGFMVQMEALSRWRMTSDGR